ncbi:MAG: M20/M25/M40 family metallo-hydrolase [Alphaproteobacteria bacterium]
MLTEYIQNEKKAILELLFEALRIPSISTDKAYRQDCLNQADWFLKLLETRGYKGELWHGDNDGLPAVFAQNEQIQGRKTVLFYGHYDVQPADPIELWQSNPFEPEIRDGHIYGRGANDDKGQLFTFLEALYGLEQSDEGLDLNIKIFLEGEEESGSPSLKSILSKYKDALACDVVLVSDADMWTEDQAAFTMMLRGKSGFEVTLKGPSRDLHSGLYGGVVSNPANILARIIGKMFDDDNHILIPNFYDGIKDIHPELRASWNNLEADVYKRMEDVGMSIAGGEKKYSALEQNWSRPTLEINGITSGYQGLGGKTIIPSQASVKISCRLADGQNPDKVFQSFVDFFENHIPEDIQLKIENQGTAKAFVVDHHNPYVKKAKAALDTVFPKECLLIACGASIPATIDLEEATNAPIILGGWGLPSDAIHAPNENYSLKRFFKGIEGWGAVLKSFESKEG